MNEKPLISVIMSVYNGEKFLRQSIESILSQTYINFEFIIVDDCSSDESLAIIKEYEKIDKRIKIISNKENIGLTRSLNKMLDIAKGQYIARMDSDDICEKNRLERQIEEFLTNPEIDLVFTNTRLIDFKGIYICNSYRPSDINKILKLLEIHNYIPHPTVMYKKYVIDKYGKYSIDAYNREDQELWIRLRDNNVKFHFINENLLNYRINPNSVRANKKVNEYYKIASICIVNKDKKKALTYFYKLSFKEKILITIKLMLPFKSKYIKSMFKCNCLI